MKHLPRAAPVTMERYRTKNDRAARVAGIIIAAVVVTFLIVWSRT
jgi:hypothetical protein